MQLDEQVPVGPFIAPLSHCSLHSTTPLPHVDWQELSPHSTTAAPTPASNTADSAQGTNRSMFDL
jgi:hypothetical protein